MTKLRATVTAQDPAAVPLVEVVPLTDLTPDPDNANNGTERGYYMLTNSLTERGAGRGILATSDGVILAGNKTQQAAIDSGMKRAILVHTTGEDIVVTVRDDLQSTDTTARVLALEDNRVGEIDLEWDASVLLQIATYAPEVAEEMGEDWKALLRDLDIEETGDGAGGSGAGDDAPVDRAEELQEKWQVKTGEMFRIGEHVLICGDCRDSETWARLLDVAGVGKVNGVFTSPPYAEQRKAQYGGVPVEKYVEWWDAVQSCVRENLAADGSFFVNIKPHCENGQRVLYVFDLVLQMVRGWGWKFVDEFCWKKTGFPRDPEIFGKFKNAFEPVYHFSGTKYKYNPANVTHLSDNAGKMTNSKNPTLGMTQGRSVDLGIDTYRGEAYPSNVIEAFGGEGGHAAAFPVALPDFFIRAYSDPGDVWCDCFSGSGTTIVAAHKNGRRGLGIELLPKYVSVSLERMAMAFPELMIERIEGGNSD